MIIPQNQSAAIHFPTNDNIALKRTIESLPKEFKDNLLQTNSLPSFYYKITNLPTNQNGFGIELRLKERNSQTGAIVLLPFAFVADVALSPFYLLFIISLEIGEKTGHNNWHT